jgi:hypothetical protein
MIRQRLCLRRTSAKVLPLFIVLLTFAHDLLPAQEPDVPTVDDAQAGVPAALRGWLLPGKDSRSLLVRLRSASGEVPPLSLASSPAGSPSLAEPFTSTLAGSYICELVAGDSVLVSKEIRLGAGKSLTLLCLAGADGKFEFRLFDDGPLPLPVGERFLRILNFADGREARLQIEGKEALSVAAESIKEAKLPPRQLPISVSVLAKDGGYPAQSFVMVDLAAAASSYLTIMPDSKGRMRPRFIAGAAPPPPVPTAPLPVAPEPTAEQVQAERVALLERDLDFAVARLALLDASKKGPNQNDNASQFRKELQQKIDKVRDQIQATKASPKAIE